jgi:hypothetical protein
MYDVELYGKAVCNVLKVKASREADSSLAGRKFLRNLWNPGICLHFFKSSPLARIKMQMNRPHYLPSTVLRSISLLSFRLCIRLPNGLFASDFPGKISVCIYIM